MLQRGMGKELIADVVGRQKVKQLWRMQLMRRRMNTELEDWVDRDSWDDGMHEEEDDDDAEAAVVEAAADDGRSCLDVDRL